MKSIKTFAIAAAFGLASITAMPLQAAPNKDDCKANFTKISPDGDMALDSDQGKKYSQVATQVDVNNDGKISEDEYTVACTKDLFKEIEKTG